MRRTISETRIGDQMVRYRTRLEDEPSFQNSLEARKKLFDLLGSILNSPDLINCGLSSPQKMTIYHSGQFWVLEAEAVVEES